MAPQATNVTSTASSYPVAPNASDAVGFYGTTPVVQPTANTVTTGFTASTGTAVVSGSTFTGNTGSTAYTLGDLVAALKSLGLIAS
jgi:hypothetical protein